ncbi:hypothetical protein GQX74_000152 [Glossina fuscipes]|nr:hypothetical protein GQX74_000152 [Glossina fuscipes]
MEQAQKLLREVYENRKDLQESLTLLKVWLRQRQLDKGVNGFNARLLIMFTVTSETSSIAKLILKTSRNITRDHAQPMC